jgi:hypothetical protein
MRKARLAHQSKGNNAAGDASFHFLRGQLFRRRRSVLARQLCGCRRPAKFVRIRRISGGDNFLQLLLPLFELIFGLELHFLRPQLGER